MVDGFTACLKSAQRCDTVMQALGEADTNGMNLGSRALRKELEEGDDDVTQPAVGDYSAIIFSMDDYLDLPHAKCEASWTEVLTD